MLWFCHIVICKNSVLSLKVQVLIVLVHFHQIASDGIWQTFYLVPVQLLYQHPVQPLTSILQEVSEYCHWLLNMLSVTARLLEYTKLYVLYV